MTDLEILNSHQQINVNDFVNVIDELSIKNNIGEVFLLYQNKVIRDYGHLKDVILKHFNNNTVDFILLPVDIKIST